MSSILKIKGILKPFLSLRALLSVLLLPVLWMMYRSMIEYTMGMFNEPLESMSHGWLIPFVSLYALWLLRKKLQSAASSPSWAGGGLVVFCLIVFWFGSRGGQSRIEQVSLIGLLWAVPLAYWGWGVARLLIFPVGYLVFTIPLSSFLDFFTVTLRLLSTSLVCHLLNGFGVEIHRVGNSLYGAGFNLEVADGCSGIESFFAVMALTAAYAYFKHKTLFQRGVLFLFAIPIAVVGNSVRLASDCLVAVWFGQAAVGGYYHDYSGLAIALFDVFLVVEAGKLVSRMDERIAASTMLPRFLKEPQSVTAGKAGRGKSTAVFLPMAVFILILSLCISRQFVPAPYYGKADFIAKALPPKVLEFSGPVPWFCHNESCLMVEGDTNLEKLEGSDNFKCPGCGSPMYLKSLGETTDMPKDTVILKRNYRSGDGMVYSMNVVIGGKSRYSIHRAEQCLPSQGFSMEKTGTTILHLAGGKDLQVRQIDVSRKGTHNATLIYWFVSEKRVCSSHLERILLDVWDRSVHNRINRWVMFSVFIPSGLDSPESIERFEEFLSEFYPQVFLKAGSVK